MRITVVKDIANNFELITIDEAMVAINSKTFASNLSTI